MSWSHARLRSESGTNISIDFVPARFPLKPSDPSEHVVMATNGWINVQRDDFTPADKVRVFLTNEITSVQPGQSSPSVRSTTHERKMRYEDGGRFTTTFPDTSLRGQSSGQPLTARQTVWLEVNDVPEKDPLQPAGEPFNVDLSKA